MGSIPICRLKNNWSWSPKEKLNTPAFSRKNWRFSGMRSEERRVGKECRSGGGPDFSSRRRHTRSLCDWSSDVCSSDLNAKFQVSNPAREFGSAVNRNLIAGDGIDSDLPAEEQLVLVPQGEIEYASVFEKKLALLGNEYFEWRDVERFEIDFGIGKVRVAR